MVTERHSLTARYARYCLRIAVRRWPVPLRDELYREWSAELLAIDGPGGLGNRLAYAYHRIRFATSLVCSAGVTDDFEPRTRWSQLYAALPTLRAVGVALAAPWAGLILTKALQFTGTKLVETLGTTAGMTQQAQLPVQQTVMGLCVAIGLVAAVLVGLTMNERTKVLPRSVVVVSLGAGTAALATLVPQVSAVEAIAGGLILTLGLSVAPQLHIRQRWKRLTVGVLLGLAAGYLLATAIAFPHMAAHDADFRYAAAWVPAALLEADWIPLGSLNDGLPATTELNATIGTLSLVIPMAFGFGLACLARNPSKEKA